jgi:hypothetical protein
MNTTTHDSHQLASTLRGTLVSSLIAALALVLVPNAALASRIPSDPFAFTATPIAQTRMVYDAQAAHVWAALQELRSDVTGTH